MTDTNAEQIELEQKKHRLKAGIFLSTIAGVAAVAGFSRTLATSKKADPAFFAKGVTGGIEMADTGANLALRALGWGTVLAIVGVSALSFSVWKFSGAKDLQEFREKAGSILPKLSKDGPPTSRTEFTGLNDLMEYLTTWKKE